jgi:hypothetical protein
MKNEFIRRLILDLSGGNMASRVDCRMKLFCFCLILFLQIGTGVCRALIRKEIRIPDLPDRVTLKCDFHMHTVFSDGTVWPTVRVQEAWQDGLDAVAITDHLEKQAHSEDVVSNRNRSFDIAKKEGEALGLIVIRGTEITRKMPPGHFNAIFIQDAEALDQPDWRAVLASAAAQGAFIFWNHPGWNGQQPDGIAKWYDEHTEILGKGWMHGIEAVNSVDYYPQVHQWCIDKKLTLMGNSDAHDPIRMDFDPSSGQTRPLTLVFAKEKTEAGIKKALFEKRTAVYFKGDLLGNADDLAALFEKSVTIPKTTQEARRNRQKLIPISNVSAVDFRLVQNGSVEGFKFPQELFLPAGCTVLFSVRALRDQDPGGRSVAFPYRVINLRNSPQESVSVFIRLNVAPE